MLQAALTLLGGLMVVLRASSPRVEAAAHQQKHRGGCLAHLEINAHHLVVVGVGWLVMLLLPPGLPALQMHLRAKKRIMQV